MKPIDIYNQRVLSGTLVSDNNQLKTLQALQDLAIEIDGYKPRSKWLLSGLFGIRAPRPKGLYIYGGVGRGKSMLMDLFFEASPVTRKRRVHFHEFMQSIHQSLYEVRQTGVEDAIRPVAEKIISEVDLLCFDEIQITYITDAMIVSRLFEFLLDSGVIIVTTSNRHPNDLYKSGLNRSLFLPFIKMIGQRLTTLNLDSDTDHRQNNINGNIVYFYPLNEETHQKIEQLWETLSRGKSTPLILTQKKRKIEIPFHVNGIARASFADLCNKALGPGDYLVIAKSIDLLMITNVPQLGKDNSNQAKRFVTLIDTLYEGSIKVIISADAEVEELYKDGIGSFEFNRTASRLREMQSEVWGT